MQHEFLDHERTLASAPHDISLMACDTDASKSTRAGTKCHILPLNSHLNMTTAMVSLMAPSRPYDSKHVSPKN